MDREPNLRYKIPQPLKEITEDIASCIYKSEFCLYDSADIATAIVISAVKNQSLETVARFPNADTVFWRIGKGITFEKLERLAKTQRPPKGSHIKILIDGHDVMFHGKDALGVVGTKPKDGTSKSFKYLAAYSNTQPKGIVALRELFDGSVTEDAMKMISDLAKDYVIDLVVMDGEFYKAELVEYLSKAGIPFVVRRTNTGNIRELNISYDKPHYYETTVKRKDGTDIDLSYWLYRYNGRDGDFYLASNIKTTQRKLRRMQKTRWNIETGFREVNRVKIKTTTRDFLVRLFFYTISCILYNLWQKIKFRYGLLAMRFDEVIGQVKRFVKESVLQRTDFFGRLRRRYIRLAI